VVINSEENVTDDYYKLFLLDVPIHQSLLDCKVPIMGSVGNMEVTVDGRDVGDYSIYSCLAGFVFATGGSMSIYSARCGNDGNWHLKMPSCKGNLKLKDIRNECQKTFGTYNIYSSFEVLLIIKFNTVFVILLHHI